MNNLEQAYQVLRDKAIRFQFKPGEHLLEVELARTLQMSRAPVREAMNRLVTEGLLTVVPNFGFSCRKLSASEIASLYRVRADLEVGGLRESEGQLDPTALKALARSWKETTAKADELSIENLVTRDEQFHLKLATLSGNMERVRLLEHINARIFFVRKINIEDAARRRSTFAEHHDIVAELLAGNTAGAVDILRQHLKLSAEESMESVRRGLERIYAESIA